VRWPLHGVEIVVLSPEPCAPYSGMVPGWLAGLYRYDEIVVDFPPLAAAARARWCPNELQSLDPARRRITLADGSVMDYDLLSLNVGSTLVPPPAAHATMLPLRPLSLLRQRVDALLALWTQDTTGRPFVVNAIGGGPAGVEGLLALLQRLRTLRPDRVVRGGLLTRGSTLLPGLSAAAQRAASKALHRAGVVVQLGSGWCEAVDRSSDVVVWATGAQAHAWQRDAARRGALAVDEAGFVRIDAQLRSVSHPRVFAVGDCASWQQHPLPKAGVHAVRMGPTLAHNLRVALGAAGAPATHRPQRRFLALLSTGDGRAIVSRGPFGAEGRWAWRWKDHIDRRFIDQFTGIAPSLPQPWPPCTGDSA
jgi:NADH dehydrogenase FAD-containing subunit